MAHAVGVDRRLGRRVAGYAAQVFNRAIEQCEVVIPNVADSFVASQKRVSGFADIQVARWVHAIIIIVRGGLEPPIPPSILDLQPPDNGQSKSRQPTRD